MKIGIGIFTEYVAQKLGEQTGEIVLTVSDRKDVVSDPIGGECWTELLCWIASLKNTA